MDSYYERTLSIISINGLNFGKNKAIFWTILSFVNLVGITLTAVQEVLYPIFEKSRLLDKLISVPGILIAIEAGIKLYNGIRNKERIKQLMNTLDDLYLEMDSVEQVDFRRRSFKLRQPAVFFGSGYIVLSTVCNTLPVFVMIAIYCARNEWIYIYPYHFWFPFDNIKYFVATYIYEVYECLICATGVVGLDVLCAMLVALIGTHFHHLRLKFQNLINEASEDYNYTMKHKEELTRLVNIHLCLNQQCNILNDIFGFSFFLRIIFSSFVICCSGFAAASQTNFTVLAEFAGIAIVTILHTFFVCWYGNQLEEKVWSTQMNQ